MILDVKPSKGVVLRWDDAGTYGDRLGEGDGHGTQVADVLNVYTDHHATCPDAAAWKGKPKKDPSWHGVDSPWGYRAKGT
jgi:hypothetical protein